MRTEPIRVGLADDHEMVRAAIAALLSDTGDIEVVGQAGNRHEALQLFEAHRPDVMVVDYSMPGGGGVRLIEQLLAADRKAKVMVLTVHESIHYAVGVLEVGALGYVIKSAPVAELVAAIKAVHAGDVFLSQKVSQRVINQLRKPKTERSGVGSLSQREFEVLRILGSGAGLQEAAKHLSLSVSTVSTYRSRLMEKLHLETTAELIRYAIEHDVVG